MNARGRSDRLIAGHIEGDLIMGPAIALRLPCSWSAPHSSLSLLLVTPKGRPKCARSVHPKPHFHPVAPTQESRL